MAVFIIRVIWFRESSTHQNPNPMKIASNVTQIKLQKGISRKNFVGPSPDRNPPAPIISNCLESDAVVEHLRKQNPANQYISSPMIDRQSRIEKSSKTPDFIKRLITILIGLLGLVAHSHSHCFLPVMVSQCSTDPVFYILYLHIANNFIFSVVHTVRKTIPIKQKRIYRDGTN